MTSTSRLTPFSLLHPTMPFPLDTVQKRLDTQLGFVRLAASSTGLCGLWFENQRHAPALLDGPQSWPVEDGHPLLCRAAQQLTEWLAGQRQCFDLPLDLSSGTPFQQNAWRALLLIERGDTCSYGDLARKVGSAKAVRAVGAAIGRNPVSLVVPCHRVVGAGGALTGYAGGLERKRALLALEAGTPLSDWDDKDSVFSASCDHVCMGNPV